MSDLHEVMGEKIKEARTKKGISQEELAYLAGTTQCRISEVEKGRRDIKVGTLERIAGSLGVKVSTLLGGCSEPVG